MFPDTPTSDLGETVLDGDDERRQLPGRGVGALKKYRDPAARKKETAVQTNRNFEPPWPRQGAQVCVAGWACTEMPGHSFPMH